MKMTFRWYGSDDPVTLDKIRQIPNMYGIVSAIYDVPVGQIWPVEKIEALKKEVESKGLTLEVIESVPVHEDIKLGRGKCAEYIENYKINIRNLAKAGVKCICYNFMPIFDWTRTQLDKELPDGSNALVYYADQLAAMDPLSGSVSLPGWDSSFKKEDLKDLFEGYAKLDKEGLWANLKHFLEEIIPVAAENDVKMAIHPDDPPWDIFGLPRLITCEANVDRFLSLVDSPYNGLTLCTGSLGCSKTNDMVKMVQKYAGMGKIHFAHIRNVKILENGDFEEAAHFSACGSLDIVGILKAYHDAGFTGYVRPDHGRMIWGETGKPGYGLYDRALGAVYMNGIWETLEKLGK